MSLYIHQIYMSNEGRLNFVFRFTAPCANENYKKMIEKGNDLTREFLFFHKIFFAKMDSYFRYHVINDKIWV